MIKNQIRLPFPIEWLIKLDFVKWAQSQKFFSISSHLQNKWSKSVFKLFKHKYIIQVRNRNFVQFYEEVEKVEHNFRDLATFGLCTQGRRNRRVLETFGHDRSNNFLLELFPIFGYSAGSTTDKGD